ncbi:MAG: hypothetical protein B7Y26_07385 [Hydrogenophilales bacterium 16-64-46]|nr:MAG: hypothetical protein B7Y26_07385 [Hydrogenophilales bacterium 16-64-46]HQT00428.1 hypothetical protein [Thiobacillus sp.]
MSERTIMVILLSLFTGTALAAQQAQPTRKPSNAVVQAVQQSGQKSGKQNAITRRKINPDAPPENLEKALLPVPGSP